MSKQIKELLNDVLEAENTMIELYARLSRDLKNEKVAGILKQIMRDEGRHASNARKMLKILGE